MATVTRELLSGSSNGRQILITTTATPGDVIHTAHATLRDEIFIWVSNTTTSPVKLTIEWGGVTVPNDLLEQTIPPEAGDLLIIAGKVLTGSVICRAFAATANVLVASGYVNRITN